jgi:hypothetical protein
MKKVKWFIPLIALAAILLIVSCGDDENPSGPGDNPTASTLTATAGTTNTVFASWSMCPDNDFSEYNLYRSATSGISANPPSSPIRTSSSASDTTYSDPGLTWGETYYYAVQTRNSGGNTAWSNEVQVVIPDSGSTGDFLTCYQIQGQAASSPYDGQEVSVTGIVTSGGGELYGSFTVICDAAGGPWSGLVMYGDSANSLVRGDSITITGTVAEHFGLTELTYLNDIQVISTGHSQPAPIQLTTVQATEEQYESVVVAVTDAVVLTATSNSYEIDDGSGSCYLGTRGNFTEPNVGDTVDVQGPLMYDFDEWRIQPRDNSDITISGGGGGTVLTCYEVQGQQSASPYDGQTVSVTGIVVVGGDEYYSSSASYAVIMDAGGGAWHGLTLYGTDVSSLARGDSITITGTVDEFDNFGGWIDTFTELIYPTAVTVHSSGHTLPSPESVDTGDAGQEQWESVLLSVSDVTVTEDDLGYGEWAVDDGSGDCRIDDLGDYTYTPSIGDTFTEIIGVCWYSFDNFKIEPRDDSDLTN